MIDFGSVLVRSITTNSNGLILINGKWGSGKTYYLTNKFKTIYHEMPIYYMSLLGVNNIDDFKNKLVKTAYLDSPHEIEGLNELIKSALNSFKRSAGDAFSQGVEFFSGAIKERVLNKLEGVFIIDDIERIDTSLRQEILTYCYQNQQNTLIQNTKSTVTYIFVGNFSNENDVIIAHKEKLISDEIIFPGIESSEFIIQKIIKHNICTDTLTTIIRSLSITNLRIIEKIISKINCILELIPTSDTPSPGSFSSFVNNISACVLLKEQYGFRRDTFDKYKKEQISRFLSTIDREGQNEKDTEIESVFDKISALDEHKEKLFNYTFNIESAKDLFHIFLPITSEMKEEDYAYLQEPHLTDIDENSYARSLRDAILKTNNPPLSKWLKAVRNYTAHKEKMYVREIKEITNEVIRKKRESFSHDEILRFVKNRFPQVEYIEDIHFSEDMDEHEKYFKEKYFEIRKGKAKKKIITKMTEQGWLQVGQEITREPFRTQLLGIIGVKNIINALEKCWSPRDILDFRSTLTSTYTYIRLYHKPSEIHHLTALSNELSNMICTMEPSFKLGAIIQLKETIEQILTQQK